MTEHDWYYTTLLNFRKEINDDFNLFKKEIQAELTEIKKAICDRRCRAEALWKENENIEIWHRVKSHVIEEDLTKRNRSWWFMVLTRILPSGAIATGIYIYAKEKFKRLVQ